MISFSCRTCKGETFQASEMKKEKYLFARNRGICKPCATQYEKHQQFIRKVDKNPENFLTCDDCDRFFSKFVTGSPGNNINRQLRVDCPYCKSENIARI